MDDITISKSYIASEEGSSSHFTEQNFSHEDGNSAGIDNEFQLHGISSILPLDLGQDFSLLQKDCISNENHDIVNTQFHTSGD